MCLKLLLNWIKQKQKQAQTYTSTPRLVSALGSQRYGAVSRALVFSVHSITRTIFKLWRRKQDYNSGHYNALLDCLMSSTSKSDKPLTVKVTGSWSRAGPSFYQHTHEWRHENKQTQPDGFWHVCMTTSNHKARQTVDSQRTDGPLADRAQDSFHRVLTHNHE
jgi:hypothetical protein